MGKPIRCGLLGIGHAHGLGKLQVLQESPDYELVGVCEPDDAIRSQWQNDERLDGVRWLAQDELLGDESVSMVAVESTVPQLLPLGRAAIDAGKHIHLDKPAGTSLAEFQTLLDVAASRDLIVQMGYMFRYNTGFDFIRRAVGQDWLGHVYAIHGSMCTDIPRGKRAALAFHPGGMMLELGCHLLDMILLLLGPPAKVTPFLRHDGEVGDELNDNTLAVLEYDCAMATIETAAMEPDAFPKRRFKVSGTRGTILLEPLEPPTLQLCLREPAHGFQAGWQTVPIDDVPRYVRDMEDLARCIRGESTFGYAKEHDYNVQRTLLGACGIEALSRATIDDIS